MSGAKRLPGPAVAGAGALAALVVAGCGSTLDGGELAKNIDKHLASQGVTVHGASCPDDVPAKVGTNLTCTAYNRANSRLIIRGHVTSIHGSRARAHYKVVGAIARRTKVVAEARALLERKVGQRARSLTCPKVVHIPTRPSVTCRLTAMDGTMFNVAVRVDAEHGLRAKVADHPVAGPGG
jgi:hypothetical protein